MPDDRNTAREIAQDETNKQVMLMLGRLEGKVDTVIASQQSFQKIIDEHEIRIQKSERLLDNVKIKVGLIGAIIGALTTAFGNWLWAKFTGQK
jgi:hypothetical protein